MVSKRTDLEVNVTARADQAKRELAEVADDARALEGEHEVGVTVDDDATDEIADIRAKLDSLSDEDREIALSITARNLEREVSRAESALGKLDKYDNEEIEIRLDARDQASRKLDAVRDELRRLDGDTADVKIEATGLSSLESRLANIGGGVGLGAVGKGGLIGGAVAGAGLLADKFADAAIEAQTIADAFGAPVERASRLLKTAELTGVEYNDIYDLLGQFNQAIQDTPELAEKLKIDPEDNIIDQFLTAVENLNTEVDDVGERGVIAAQLFGEEGVRQIGRMQTELGDIEATMDGISDANVISDADVESARKIKDELRQANEYWGALQRGVGRAAGQVLLPAVNDILGGGRRTTDTLPQHRPGQDLLNRLTFGIGGNSGSDPYVRSDNTDSDTIMGLDLTGRMPSNVPPRPNGQVGTVIINPPGTPAATSENIRIQDRRNGNR